MRLSIVDVFAEQRYEGNQLAVVRDAGALDPDTMQQIAKEMNFSETTFVTAEAPDHASVRIFTPAQELPFAGHPTLGAAWVLAGDRGSIRLDLEAGPVDVTFVEGTAWMTPPEPELREPLAAADAQRLVGDDVAIDTGWPARYVYSGAQYCLVPVASMDDLRRVTVDTEALRGINSDMALFTVCRHTDGNEDFAVRMHFHDGISIREDAATGSANSAFAAFLRALGIRGSFTVEQGTQIGRPSRLYLEIDDGLRVGGRVQLVAEGRLVDP